MFKFTQGAPIWLDAQALKRLKFFFSIVVCSKYLDIYIYKTSHLYYKIDFYGQSPFPETRPGLGLDMLIQTVLTRA